MSDFESALPLGRKTAYPCHYDPDLLCPFPRQAKRDMLDLGPELPFTGYDIWNAYELSWLNQSGKPLVALAELSFPCTTPNLVESKSLKLYLNSFNQTQFSSGEEVQRCLGEDLSRVAGGPVGVRVISGKQSAALQLHQLPGICLDDQELIVDCYSLQPGLLENAADQARPVSEELHSHLLKSNCLVTEQPDWGSLLIRYRGGRIDRVALLRYIISFRQHNEFHEQCVERVFVDLMRYCRPEQLTVYARYVRRGGLDINPFRSNFEKTVPNLRLVRQ